MQSKPGKPVGLLNVTKETSPFSLYLYLPSADLAHFIEHYWVVQWDLRGKDAHLQENLPHPSVHLVFEKRNSRIVGVMKGRHAVVLRDKGAVLGVKFRPGAFYPFLKTSVSTITDQTLPFQEVFGMDSQAMEQELFSKEETKRMVPVAEAFIRDHLPEPDINIDLIHSIIQCVNSERNISDRSTNSMSC